MKIFILLATMITGYSGAATTKHVICSTVYGEVDLYVGDKTALIIEGSVLEVEHIDRSCGKRIIRQFVFDEKKHLIHVKNSHSFSGKDDYLAISKDGKKVTYSLACFDI